MRAAPLALALALLAAGCFGGEKKRTTGCPSADGLASSVCGDVDGDGRPERVGIGPSLALVARTGGREISLPIAEDARAAPSVNGLAAIDRQPGLEIVATVGHGASTEFADVFTLAGGRLIRFSLPASAPQPAFAYNGSVTHLDGVDCAPGRPGTVVATAISEQRIEQRTYQVTRAGFLLVDTHTSTQAQGAQPTSIEQPQPFPSCMKVRSG
jgi:hypothetical protein